MRLEAALFRARLLPLTLQAIILYLVGALCTEHAKVGTLTTISAPQRMRYTHGMRKERNLESYIILFQATNISKGTRDGSRK